MWETDDLGPRSSTDALTKEIRNILRGRGSSDVRLPDVRLPDVVEQSWKRCL